jgi:hypothetical protein
LIPFVNGNINSSCLQRVCCQWHHSGPRGQWLMLLHVWIEISWGHQYWGRVVCPLFHTTLNNYLDHTE